MRRFLLLFVLVAGLSTACRPGLGDACSSDRACADELSCDTDAGVCVEGKSFLKLMGEFDEARSHVKALRAAGKRTLLHRAVLTRVTLDEPANFGADGNITIAHAEEVNELAGNPPPLRLVPQATRLLDVTGLVENQRYTDGRRYDPSQTAAVSADLRWLSNLKYYALVRTVHYRPGSADGKVPPAFKGDVVLFEARSARPLGAVKLYREPDPDPDTPIEEQRGDLASALRRDIAEGFSIEPAALPSPE